MNRRTTARVPNMDEIKSKLRKLRLIQLLLIAFVLISASLAELTFARTGSHWSLQHWLMSGLAVVCMLEGFNFRYRFLPPASVALARDPASPKALRRWEAWLMMCITMAGTVAMC